MIRQVMQDRQVTRAKAKAIIKAFDSHMVNQFIQTLQSAELQSRMAGNPGTPASLQAPVVLS